MSKRKSLLVAVSLAVLAMVLVLVIGGETRQTAAGPLAPSRDTRQVTYTVTLPLILRNLEPDFISPLGIVMYGHVDDASGLEVVRQAGAQWVTTNLTWSSIERTPGNYVWSSFDTKAQNAQAAGMSMFVLFTGNPSWAAALPGGPVTDTQDLVNFATLMTERYDCDGVDDADGHPCVHFWSFYAEPDNGDLTLAENGKGYWGHNGAGYAAMLSQVAPAMHAASPSAQVLIGGLAYDYFEEDGGPYVRTFLADTLTALNALGGADAYVDSIPFHYYPISAGRWPTIREKTVEIQAILASHGAGGIPLVCPEMGYWSSPKFGSSEAGQASRLVQMHVRALSMGVGQFGWYKVFDTAVANSADDLYPDRTAGLLRVDYSFKPSYYALKTMASELARYYYNRQKAAAGAEGYVFRRADGREKTVVWSSAGTANVAFPYTHLRVVTIAGDEYHFWDNQPGDLDGGVVGQITIAVYENQPLFVEP